jgi:RNA polymerase sigma-70 factor (ECF subfamily)
MEEQILAWLRARDERGVEALLRQYGPLMRYIIRPILPNEQDAEDCLADVSLRIWEKIHTYDSARGSFTAWLTAVTRNTAIQQARRKNSETDDTEEEPVSPDPTPEERVLRQERREEGMRLLARLSRTEQSLIYRKYYYRQSTEKIAAEMGMTPRAVEGKLYRVRKKLQKWMGGDGRA